MLNLQYIKTGFILSNSNKCMHMSMLSLCVYCDLISTNVSLRFIYITAKMRCFRVRLAGFINLIFFCKDQMAQTNAKTPRFRHNVNEPLDNDFERKILIIEFS